MGKIVIIMNGHGGTGKDTLCGFAEGIYSVRNVSSAEPIKEIARKYADGRERRTRNHGNSLQI